MISSVLPNWAEAITAALSVATLLAVVLAAIQVRHVNRQMHRDLEMQYLLRFWTLMDRRSEKFMLAGRPTRSDRLILREYLGLSEDQSALRSLGRVTDHTWEYWGRDIRAMCASVPVKEEIYRSAHTDYPHLRRLLADKEYDPLRRGRAWRLWQGL